VFIIVGCVRDRVLYNHNTTISFNCSASCTCRSGTWDCQPKNCYNDICQSYTLGHFITFDSTSYDVHGACEYVLAKPCDNDNFIISAVYALQSGELSPAIIDRVQVTVSVPDIQIVLQRNGEVKINGNNLIKLDGNNMIIGEVKVEWIGSYPHVTFEDTGIDVFWDATGSVQVSVSSSLRNNLCGMCGFYSGSGTDDFRKSDGTITQNITDFALSWVRESRQSRRCNNPAPLDKTGCRNRVSRNGRRVCNLMNNPPFDICNSIVDPQPYISNCEFNFCLRGRRNRHRSACTAIANYARACANAGVIVENWRDGLQDCCKLPIANFSYKICGCVYVHMYACTVYSNVDFVQCYLHKWMDGYWHTFATDPSSTHIQICTHCMRNNNIVFFAIIFIFFHVLCSQTKGVHRLKLHLTL